MRDRADAIRHLHVPSAAAVLIMPAREHAVVVVAAVVTTSDGEYDYGWWNVIAHHKNGPKRTRRPLLYVAVVVADGNTLSRSKRPK